MDGIGHLITFTITWIGLLIWRIIIKDLNMAIFYALWFAFLATNPDLDLLIGKLFKRVIHRWWLTHSVIFPIILYESIKYYLKDGFLAKEFGFILFLPVIVHLLADFRIGKLLNKDNKDTAGTWQISLFPFRKKRLGPKLSVAWMVSNLIAVTIYTLIIYGFLS